MKSTRINKQLYAYLNGNLSEAEIKAFEKEMMNNPELNHEVNQERFKQQQSTPRKETNNKPNRINWLPIIVILVSALFASQYFSKTDDNQILAEANTQQQNTAVDADGANMSTAEIMNKGTRAIVERETNQRRSQEAENPPVVKSIAQYKSTAQKENRVVEPSVGLEYVMLAKQLYSASDYPTGEEHLAKDAKPIQNKSLFEGITAYSNGNNMNQAILNFQKINRSAEREDYEMAKPYLAHAHFKQGDYIKAKRLFEELCSSPDRETAADAEWFLTLSLLSDFQEEQRKVDVLLEKMLKKENKHPHFKDAVYLKEDLEKIHTFNLD